MKAKELIKILKSVDPESEVELGIGRYHDEEYRNLCAKAQLLHGECLDCLRIDCVVIHKVGVDENPFAGIILQQYNFSDLSSIGRNFDEKYNIKKEGE